MNTISTITILPLTKDERSKFINNVVNEFNNLQEFEQQRIFVQMKIAIDTLEKIMKHNDVRSSIIDRMENNKIENGLAEISLSHRKTYDFSQDEKWINLDFQIKRLKAEQKLQEGILKALREQVADIDTGEIRNPAMYNETEILTIKLK